MNSQSEVFRLGIFLLISELCYHVNITEKNRRRAAACHSYRRRTYFIQYD